MERAIYGTSHQNYVCSVVETVRLLALSSKDLVDAAIEETVVD